MTITHITSMTTIVTTTLCTKTTTRFDIPHVVPYITITALNSLRVTLSLRSGPLILETYATATTAILFKFIVYFVFNNALTRRGNDVKSEQGRKISTLM